MRIANSSVINNCVCAIINTKQPIGSISDIVVSITVASVLVSHNDS